MANCSRVSTIPVLAVATHVLISPQLSSQDLIKRKKKWQCQVILPIPLKYLFFRWCACGQQWLTWERSTENVFLLSLLLQYRSASNCGNGCTKCMFIQNAVKSRTVPSPRDSDSQSWLLSALIHFPGIEFTACLQFAAQTPNYWHQCIKTWHTLREKQYLYIISVALWLLLELVSMLDLELESQHNSGLHLCQQNSFCFLSLRMLFCCWT